MTASPQAWQGDAAVAFADWIGRHTEVDDEIGLSAARRMAAMLDQDPSAYERGSVLPPHWYSMFFTPNARRSQIGHDGHPKKGDFLPPIPLPRRMFVGRRVGFPGELRVSDRASKRSEIVAIEQKNGRSGVLVFVTVRHTISVGDRPAVVEHQQVVYRDAPAAGQAAAAAATEAPKAAWQASYVMDPVLVFRYSALTWNGHRIHYDADYARREEGYPGCVMNGALTVHLVIDEAVKRLGGRRLTGLSARLSKPLFVGGTLVVGGSEVVGGTLQAWASDEQGALAAQCTLEIEDAP
ncbi:hypothetical protein FOZ76_00855 [Verticiella sediminum]|uniref:Uncharacterized protein n=1 Tax=Verticiella sediminum TaxID=1247510 RepID=A0A556B1B7_9BURK|nr:MaoC family dehydratase N-terminal domain-containing protein [Verticiella sediminum]TSH98952.1 hypothetical protein FOZ76_00855 [Verticiella sediminum]